MALLLNGLIHVKTKRPGLDPVTQVNVQGGLYGKPRQDGTPLYGGLDLSHSRRIKNFDLTVGLIHSWTTGIGRIITIAVSGSVGILRITIPGYKVELWRERELFV